MSRVTCDYCRKTFKRKQTLNTHVQKFHGGNTAKTSSIEYERGTEDYFEHVIGSISPDSSENSEDDTSNNGNVKPTIDNFKDSSGLKVQDFKRKKSGKSDKTCLENEEKDCRVITDSPKPVFNLKGRETTVSISNVNSVHKKVKIGKETREVQIPDIEEDQIQSETIVDEEKRNSAKTVNILCTTKVGNTGRNSHELIIEDCEKKVFSIFELHKTKTEKEHKYDLSDYLPENAIIKAKDINIIINMTEDGSKTYVEMRYIT